MLVMQKLALQGRMLSGLIEPSMARLARGGPRLHRSPGHHVDGMAPLVRIATHLRTVLAAHVPLKLVDRCCFRSADHIECNGLVRVATEAPHFEIEVARVQRVTQCRRWLRRSTEAEHALASHAGLSACLRASLARSAAARTDAP